MGEAASERRFDWLVRLRSDLQWDAPIGDLSSYDRDSLHLLQNFRQLGDVPDYFALVPRQHAQAYFSITCLTENDTARFACSPGNLGGGLFTCECAHTVRLAQMGVKVVPFPPIFRVVRSHKCYAREQKCGGAW